MFQADNMIDLLNLENYLVGIVGDDNFTSIINSIPLVGIPATRVLTYYPEFQEQTHGGV